jgi:WD40 repeat protein
LRSWALPRAYLENQHHLVNGRLRFSVDGQFLITYGKVPYPGDDIDGCPVRVYQVATGKLRYDPLPVGSLVFDIACSPDGRYLATAEMDRTVHIWDFERGRIALEGSQPLEHPDWVMDLAFHQNCKYLLTACRDGMARLWNWRTGELAALPMRHRDEVFHVSFSADGRWIVTASADGSVRIWDARLGQVIAPPLPCGASVWDLKVTPDGRRILAASRTAAIQVFQLDELTSVIPLSAEALCHWQELVADATLYQNRGISNLPPGQWLKRWRRFRSQHPGFARISDSRPDRDKRVEDGRPSMSP